MMTEQKIREFVDEATHITGDWVSVVERITQRWLKDQKEAATGAVAGARQALRDSWSGGVGG